MKYLMLLLPLLLNFDLYAQNSVGVAINNDNSDPDNSAILDVKSTSQGILIPRMTESERDNISSPAIGLLVYQTNGSAGFYYHDGNDWMSLTGTSTSLTAPVLTTTAASSITSTGTSTGGIISSDGGASVTARGVCYGTSANPTTSGTITSDGTGTGSYTSTLSNLNSGTTYYVRSYATNSVGTSYGSQISFNTLSPSYSVGNLAEGGIIYYILQSGDQGYSSTVQHGLVVSIGEINSSDKNTQFGCKGTTVGTSYSIGTGQANTTAILAACSTSGIAAELCDNYSVNSGGVTYNDWYLPSYYEIHELYNASTYGGGSITLTTNFSHIEYYSSSEETNWEADYAFHLHFSGYHMHSDKKDKNKNVVAVRSF